MNYKRNYELLIEKAKNRELTTDVYIEKHHIIPKCMNSDGEMVCLTAREHYLAHWLLYKIYPKNNKLFFALQMMTTTKKDERQLKLSSREYENIKKLHSKLKTGNKNPMYMKGYKISGDRHPMWGKFGINHNTYGRKHTSEELENMRKKKTCKLIKIDGVCYFSIGYASRVLNINRTTISSRLNSENEKFIKYKYM